MRTFFVTAFIWSACFAAQAQQSAPTNETPKTADYGCSFYADSGHYDLVENGKIIKVIDENTVIFKDSRSRNMRVDLLSIDAGTNKKDAKSFLEKNVLNFEAELIYSPERFSQKDVSGIILIDKKSINRLMLEQGIAGYKRSKLYEIAHFYDCVHRKSEEKAKQKKLGIWADNAARR